MMERPEGDHKAPCSHSEAQTGAAARPPESALSDAHARAERLDASRVVARERATLRREIVGTGGIEPPTPTVSR